VSRRGPASQGKYRKFSKRAQLKRRDAQARDTRRVLDELEYETMFGDPIRPQAVDGGPAG
jgi:hypothetical protein